MKKTYIITFLLLLALINANSQEQDPRWALTLPIEKEIKSYINNNINSFILTQKDLSSIQESINNGELLQSDITEHTEIIKRYRLRSKYFQNNPEIGQLYYANYNDNLKQTQLNCQNGNFEQGFLNYSFFSRVEWNHPGGNNVNLGQFFDPSFTAFTPSGVLNNNSNASLVTPGFDPILQTFSINLPRVLTGNRAIKLNPRNGSGIPTNNLPNQEDLTILTRNFNTIDEAILSLNFAVIFDNPSHAEVHNPFVRFEVYDNVLNTIVDSRVITSNNSNGVLNDIDNSNWRYTNWSCLDLDVSQSLGNSATLRIIVSDCVWEEHDAILYLDDICNNGNVCNTSLFGSLFLDPVNLNCPTDSFQVCGTYNNPSNISTPPAITLDIVDNTGTTIPVSDIPIIDVINGTFCFTVDASDFGTNPTGSYEFLATGTFGTGSQQITIQDNDANVGADVSFINCVDPCDDIIPDIAFIYTDNIGCYATFTGSNLGTNCINQTYAWEIFNNGTLVYTTNGITFNETDFDFTSIQGNYTITLTITSPNSSNSTTISWSVPDDCYIDPCDYDALDAQSNGSDIVWNDIATTYTLEFSSDARCLRESLPEGWTPGGILPIITHTITTTATSVNIYNDIVLVMDRENFRWRIKADDCDWSDWCCLTSKDGGQIDDFYNIYAPECFPATPCDDFEPSITLVSPTNDVNSSSGDFNYDNFDDITASNNIEPTFSSIYRASDFIRLTPGFHAKDNSNFRAYIEECVFIIGDGLGNKISKNSDRKEISNDLNKDLKVFPNPAQTEINLSINEVKIEQYQLYNIHGQLVKSAQNISENKQTINVQELSRGFYILKVILEDGSVTNKNIILK